MLLDLNYTLVENADERSDLPFAERIGHQRYRQWLVELVRPLRVFILTARPHRYRELTLVSVEHYTGWKPERYYGNTEGEPPPIAKERMLTEHLLPEFGAASLAQPSPFLGIESNPRTRAMYARHLIPSLPCQALSPSSNLTQVWKSLATGLFATSP